jgi:hypothetical protein
MNRCTRWYHASSASASVPAVLLIFPRNHSHQVAGLMQLTRNLVRCVPTSQHFFKQMLTSRTENLKLNSQGHWSRHGEVGKEASICAGFGCASLVRSSCIQILPLVDPGYKVEGFKSQTRSLLEKFKDLPKRPQC